MKFFVQLNIFSIFVFFMIEIVAGQNRRNSCAVGETCKKVLNCIPALQGLENGIFPTICGFEGETALVCCVGSKESSSRPSTTVSKSSGNVEKQSKAKQVCERYINDACHKDSVVFNDKLYKPLVVGGTEAAPKEFPHMALIGFGEYSRVEWLCGGSLISERYVLSAGHCTTSSRGPPRWVRLGELNLETTHDDAKPQDFAIIERIAHPDYKSPLLYNDIALFKLNTSVKFNDYIRPICLETAEFLDFYSLYATGWGSTNYGESDSPALLSVDLHQFPLNTCQNAYGKDAELPNGIDSESMLCVGYASGGKDTCQGDSGGPLQYVNSHVDCPYMYIQVGVTSFGKMCGYQGVPGIYTRVSTFVPWIESIVWK